MRARRVKLKSRDAWNRGHYEYSFRVCVGGGGLSAVCSTAYALRCGIYWPVSWRRTGELVCLMNTMIPAIIQYRELFYLRLISRACVAGVRTLDGIHRR